jgi:DUF4097 and DUF4098 domain-containing protein YvlB
MEGKMRMTKRNIRSEIIFFVLAAFVSALRLNAAEEQIQKSFDVDPGGKLFVDTDMGSIDVQTSPGHKIEVEILIGKESWSDGQLQKFIKRFHVQARKTGNNVTIQCDYDYHHSWNRQPEVKFQISIPSRYDLELNTSGGSIKVEDLEGSVICKTSGGSLDFGRIQGSVHGNTSGGSIHIDGCNGNVDVESSGGSISIGSTKGDIRANTSGGAIDIEETYGAVQAGSSGGSVSARFGKSPTKDCSLETSGGDIVITALETLRVDLDAATSGGRVRTDFPVTVSGEINPQSLKASINGGGPLLHLRTSGGSIRIEKFKEK